MTETAAARIVRTLVLGAALAGCALLASAGAHVELLTGVEACYAGGQSPTNGGLLVPDPEYGTRFDGQGPVMWPVGYQGRRTAAGAVEVLNPDGEVVATTGRNYRFSPVPPQDQEVERALAEARGVKVCDSYPWDFEEAPANP